uniref:Transcriptional-regulating factor 1-like n=1 Tax=Petromyzon marinus TaxID=7757 RepID=A0AAJ7T2W5_PETMA|nr:transcriptional-regulating factor 1-like [Petromyzon marinus]
MRTWWQSCLTPSPHPSIAPPPPLPSIPLIPPHASSSLPERVPVGGALRAPCRHGKEPSSRSLSTSLSLRSRLPTETARRHAGTRRDEAETGTQAERGACLHTHAGALLTHVSSHPKTLKPGISRNTRSPYPLLGRPAPPLMPGPGRRSPDPAGDRSASRRAALRPPPSLGGAAAETARRARAARGPRSHAATGRVSLR